MSAPQDQPIQEPASIDLPDDAPGETRTAMLSSRRDVWARAAAAGAPWRQTLGGWWGVGLSIAALVAIAATVGLLARPQTTLADVAAAVAGQPWVHARAVRDGDRVVEAWFSIPQDVVAFRSDRVREYRDYRRKLFYAYDPAEKVLYQLPEVGKRRPTRFESMATAMTLLAEQERTLEKPLERLEFLGRKREGMQVVSQQVERVTDEGREWIDYRLSVKHAVLAEPMQILIRVDALTRLPRLFRMEAPGIRQAPIDETWFDYPQTGPADVYALGVPKSATLVDRVPQGDLKKILAALQAGRSGMDDYRAIVVRHSLAMDYLWWCDLPHVIYRKGNKLRTDYVSSWKGDLLAVERPGENADLAAWWRKHVEFFRMYPQYVMQGDVLYSVNLKPRNGEDASREEIASVRTHEFSSFEDEAIPIDYASRPEFACRPPLGIGGQHTEPILEMKPTEGPPGCVLLRVRDTSQRNRIAAATEEENRFWLDPERGYIVMRWDSIARNAAGEEELRGSTITEEVARSPGGVWYATRMRRPDQKNGPSGEAVHGDVVHMYVEFGVLLPHALFDPPVPGKLP
jgi:hypothetical protein